jgi:hypothetical protein
MEEETRKLRSRVADSCLVEEKLDKCIGEVESAVMAGRLIVSKFLLGVCSRIQVSNSLMNLIGIKRREQALIHIEKLQHASDQ